MKTVRKASMAEGIMQVMDAEREENLMKEKGGNREKRKKKRERKRETNEGGD